MNAKLIRTKKIVSIIVTALFFVYKLSAQTVVVPELTVNYPVPSNIPDQLFYLQRNSNINTVIYTLNKTDNLLNTKNPIHPYWIMYAKDGHHEELNEIEKTHAYGIKMKPTDGETYLFALAAYPKITLKLEKDADAKYHVYATLANELMILRKVYIKAKEGALKLKPTVEYIEFTGNNPDTGKEMVTRITP